MNWVNASHSKNLPNFVVKFATKLTILYGLKKFYLPIIFIYILPIFIITNFMSRLNKVFWG